ncbi:hypothetical protein EVAR_95711_1 [Eumeta japonica]|uniref:Uncharacterized protein n=1 Tax=Eumeta variegata TaxID=151549 RepID=A0A4C1UKH1_EUMVA|nr:hypothetical protein EVAR_95711_1 [Eumeta japonica]
MDVRTEDGNPRNKCALQPGHSLMDWIRLGNSGKDLSGVGGKLRPVAPRELAAHSTEGDAWLAIRGRVYNVTHYLAYHPGGTEELMRGAGMDATELFDKVHPWVNYDSLLAKCLVGPLRVDRPDAEELFGSNDSTPRADRLREPSKAQELVRKSMENLANCITPVRKKITARSEESVKSINASRIIQSLVQSSDLPVTISRRAAASPVKDPTDKPPAPLRFDWIQTSQRLTLSVYTGPLANPGGCAQLCDGVLSVDVVTDGWLRTLRLDPEKPLVEPLQFKVYAESGKIEVTAHKEEAGVWRGCGEAEAGAATRTAGPRTLRCAVSARARVSHDTVLLSLRPLAVAVAVPLGYHIRLHFTQEDGSECVRSYTPVGEGWGGELGALRLAVKRYEAGALSPRLAALEQNDSITVSSPYGNFQLQRLKNARKVYLVAAGTGITPMLGLIKFLLSKSNPRCELIHLLFFNKKEEDILFSDKFDEITKEDDRFITTHVLSEASSAWKGLTGRINSALISQCFGKDSLTCTESCGHFAAVCGPTEFTQTALELFSHADMSENCVHAFMG